MSWSLLAVEPHNLQHGWDLQLGDIRGAFLEADALDRKKGSLYSSLPPGGIPGVPDGSVILVLGNIHGLNDAPQRWGKILMQS